MFRDLFESWVFDNHHVMTTWERNLIHVIFFFIHKLYFIFICICWKFINVCPISFWNQKSWHTKLWLCSLKMSNTSCWCILNPLFREFNKDLSYSKSSLKDFNKCTIVPFNVSFNHSCFSLSWIIISELRHFNFMTPYWNILKKSNSMFIHTCSKLHIFDWFGLWNSWFMNLNICSWSCCWHWSVICLLCSSINRSGVIDRFFCCVWANRSSFKLRLGPIELVKISSGADGTVEVGKGLGSFERFVGYGERTASFFSLFYDERSSLELFLFLVTLYHLNILLQPQTSLRITKLTTQLNFQIFKSHRFLRFQNLLLIRIIKLHHQVPLCHILTNLWEHITQSRPALFPDLWVYDVHLLSLCCLRINPDRPSFLEQYDLKSS